MEVPFICNGKAGVEWNESYSSMTVEENASEHYPTLSEVCLGHEIFLVCLGRIAQGES